MLKRTFLVLLISCPTISLGQKLDTLAILSRTLDFNKLMANDEIHSVMYSFWPLPIHLIGIKNPYRDLNDLGIDSSLSYIGSHLIANIDTTELKFSFDEFRNGRLAVGYYEVTVKGEPGIFHISLVKKLCLRMNNRPGTPSIVSIAKWQYQYEYYGPDWRLASLKYETYDK